MRRLARELSLLGQSTYRDLDDTAELGELLSGVVLNVCDAFKVAVKELKKKDRSQSRCELAEIHRGREGAERMGWKDSRNEVLCDALPSLKALNENVGRSQLDRACKVKRMVSFLGRAGEINKQEGASLTRVFGNELGASGSDAGLAGSHGGRTTRHVWQANLIAA